MSLCLCDTRPTRAAHIEIMDFQLVSHNSPSSVLILDAGKHINLDLDTCINILEKRKEMMTFYKYNKIRLIRHSTAVAL
jgi:hypothetical protein